jgi:hypothetical protein
VREGECKIGIFILEGWVMRLDNVRGASYRFRLLLATALGISCAAGSYDLGYGLLYQKGMSMESCFGCDGRLDTGHVIRFTPFVLFCLARTLFRIHTQYQSFPCTCGAEQSRE